MALNLFAAARPPIFSVAGLIALACCAPSWVAAAPVSVIMLDDMALIIKKPIMTAVLNDSGLTISGRNPWTENPMVFWDDVEASFGATGLALNSVVPAGPDAKWGQNGGTWSNKMIFEKTATRSGVLEPVYSGLPSDAFGGSTFLGKPHYNSGAAPLFNKLYISWWYKPSMSPAVEEASNKFLRVWDDGNGKGTRISWTQMHMDCSLYSPTEVHQVQWKGWGGVVGEWNRQEAYAGLNVGQFRTWINGDMTHDFACEKSPAFPEKPLFVGVLGFDHGGYDDGRPKGYRNMKTRLDDIYIANSLARIEISDSPTWLAAKKREVLPIKTWAPNKIEATMLKGVLGSATSLYAYVVGADGQVNDVGIKLVCHGSRTCR